MGLAIFASQFVFCQVCEQHCSRFWTWESPLQEMDLSPSAGARKGEDELRKAAGGRLNDVVVRGRDSGAERGGIRGVPEAPNIFDFLLGEVEGFGDVKIRGEGLQTSWRSC